MLSESNRLRVKWPFRDGTAPCSRENHVIRAFPEMAFDRPQNGMN
jgi:hypothetical protein